ncbi:MAG: prepilin-type N-terminal cleavage/methylation domain-containing protein, partial [Pyrinomonadaceae bacterium]
MKPVAGFSLIEMAVVLIVLVLLLGGALVPLATQVEQRKTAETEKAMEEAKEALIGFALANSRLPCPDSDASNPPNGVSDPPTGGNCGNVFNGRLPWVTLNLAGADAWGRRFHYRVSPAFTDAVVTPCVTTGNNLGLCKSGVIDINTKDDTKTTRPLSTDVAAIIISYGKNGFNARTETGAVVGPPPASNADELENTGGNTTYITRTITPLQT